MMSEKTERIGIKLNKLTVRALKEFRNHMYGTPDIPVSDSFLIEEAFRKIDKDNKISRIDWFALNDKNLFVPNVTNSNDESVALRTTLSIDIEIIAELRKLQNKLIELAGSRIFLSFVIKLVVLAAVLECHSLLDDYLIK